MTERLWTLDARDLADPVADCLDALVTVGMVTDATAAAAAIAEREAEGSTYVGRDTALPHIVGAAARAPGMLVARCHPIAWGDNRVSLLLFLIAPGLDDLDASGLADVIQRVVVIGLDSPSTLAAHQHTLDLFHELGARPFERNGTTWA